MLKNIIQCTFLPFMQAANNEYNIAECEDIDNSKIDTYVCSTYQDIDTDQRPALL